MNYGNNSSIGKDQVHTVTLTDRALLTVTGVKDVLSFDDHVVEASTVCGDLTVDGDDLKIASIDIEKGELSLSGKVFGFYYSEKKTKKSQGLFGKKS